jgi:hypothetical protein
LLHFILLGALAFSAYRILAPGPTETIVIRPETLRGLEERREEILGRSLTAAEKQRLERDLVEDEILIHEAYRRGLDRTDSRVRERLLDLMRARLEEPLADPGRDRLEAYFEEHIDRYWERESITFENVLFPPDSDAAPADPQAFLSALARGEFSPPTDPRRGIVETRTATPGEIGSALGPEAAERLLALDPAVWSGPIDSPLGSHYVKILERRPLPRPSFEAMAAYVRGDWELDQRAEIRSRKIAQIGAAYRVVFAEE